MATQTRLPTGEQSSTYTPSSGSDSWAMVDDPIGSPDGDTTRISRAGSAGVAHFLFPAFAITSSAIASLSVTYTRRNEVGDTTTSRATLRIGTTAYAVTDPGDSDGSTYAERTHDFLDNPDTGLAWTEADIEGTGANPLTQAGVRNQNTAGAEVWHCTQWYLTVTYTEAGGGFDPGADPVWQPQGPVRVPRRGGMTPSGTIPGVRRAAA